jgi:hypothetical protein
MTKKAEILNDGWDGHEAGIFPGFQGFFQLNFNENSKIFPYFLFARETQGFP